MNDLPRTQHIIASGAIAAVGITVGALLGALLAYNISAITVFTHLLRKVLRSLQKSRLPQP